MIPTTWYRSEGSTIKQSGVFVHGRSYTLLIWPVVLLGRETPPLVVVVGFLPNAGDRRALRAAACRRHDGQCTKVTLAFSHVVPSRKHM